VGYKTILVHCNDRQRLSRLLEPAVRLSAAFAAHLVGLSVSPPITVIPAGMPGTPDTIVVDELAKANRAYLRPHRPACRRGRRKTIGRTAGGVGPDCPCRIGHRESSERVGKWILR
jgi:hypothetical protein